MKVIEPVGRELDRRDFWPKKRVFKVTKRQAKRKLLRLLKNVDAHSVKEDDATLLIITHLGLENVLRVKKRIKPMRIKSRSRNNDTRNCLDLPSDLMLLIFTKLGVIDLLLNAQMVCSSWRKLSKQPCLFHSVDIREPPQCLDKTSFFIVAKTAMDRSCGQMVRFSYGPHLLRDKIIKYVASHFQSLKCLELHDALYSDLTKILADTAKKLCHLQELHLHYVESDFAIRMLEEISASCPNLKYFQLDFTRRKSEFIGQDETFVIARYMPHLCRLLLIGSTLTNEVLVAIIGGCPLLEYILLRGCVNIST